MKRLAAYLAPALPLLGGLFALHVAGVAQPSLIKISAMASTALATVGCFVAATAFGRGDHLRRAWMANAVSYLALFGSASLRHPAPPDWISGIRMVLTAFANLSGVIGTILFARTYGAAGLEFPLSSLVRFGSLAMTGALATVTAGISIFENVEALLAGAGGPAAWLRIFSSAGDAIQLTLIAPLMMTAFALRGGRLAHVFWLLTASYVAWLFYDGQDTITFFFQPEGTSRTLLVLAAEPFRELACALIFSAALAGRAVVREGA